MGYNRNAPKRDMVFHKTLVEASPIRVTVDGDAKWLPKKNNFIIDLTLHGNDGSQTECAYWAENNSCVEVFKGRKGQTFTVIASGGGRSDDKKASAKVTYVGEPGQSSPPPPQGAPPAQNPPPGNQTQHPPHSGAGTAHGKPGDISQNVLESLKQLGRYGSTLELAGRQTLRTVEAFCVANGVEVTPQMRRDFVVEIARHMTETTFTSMFIALDRAGRTDQMPTKDVIALVNDLAKGKSAPAPEPPKPKCPKCGAVVMAEGELCSPCKLQEQAALEKADDDVPF